MKKLSIMLALCSLSFLTHAEKIRLVIDAAHGGSDAGAFSASGDKESDLCLQYANALAIYAKTKDIEVVMTRSTKEENIPLEKRYVTQKPNDVKTIFISFHANQSQLVDTRGGVVYYSSKNPAANESKLLAEKLQSVMNQLNDIGTVVEDKAIPVLKNSVVPAVSISVGYISNPTDLYKLKDEGTQKELAMLIVKVVSE